MIFRPGSFTGDMIRHPSSGDDLTFPIEVRSTPLNVLGDSILGV